MSGHTKGPWTTDLQTQRFSDGPNNVYADGKHVCEVTGAKGTRNTPRGVTTAECEANAKLIAAAPDLLAIAKQLNWLADAHREGRLTESGLALAVLELDHEIGATTVAKVEGSR